jgi:hypothetical protein
MLVYMYQDTQRRSEMQVLVARGREFETKPLAEWQAGVRRGTDKMRLRLAFMTAEHHTVRNFAVAALSRFQRPLPVKEIASQVKLPAARVHKIVEELERHLFFLVRNAKGEVAWAFPLTADGTPHQMLVKSGADPLLRGGPPGPPVGWSTDADLRAGRIFGACAEDAFAAAFVLGRLYRRPLRIEISSVCGQSSLPLGLTVASDLSWRSQTKGADPLLFVPSVNWEGFQARNIINDY